MFSGVLHQIDKMIQDHAILQHPFYQALCAGELRHEDLAIYAWAYYPHVEAFPRYLEAAMATNQDPEIHAILLENWEEERGQPTPHPELWLRFATGLGVDRQEVLQAQPIPEVEAAIAAFSQLCEQGPLPALCTLYAYESQQPEVCHAKIQSLRDFYMVHDAQTLSYFTIHQEADVRHREETRQALQRCLTQDENTGLLFESTQRALDAHWSILDGVCRQAGLAC
ncbi:MAG: CADD family putative folate metabolism protein [Myxococcales bacterium]|nr:CADD family putative folate metabolism protein [Myxococcales bacterium]MCB9642093.1 CADD family putative folate metabolism protein [Myxococcales bacterium]